MLFAVSPWYGYERRLVEPWFLIDQCLHEDLNALETSAEWPDHRNDLLLAKHRCCETIEWQTVRCRLQTKEPLIGSRRSDRTANISADSETTSTHAQQSTFASTAAATCKVCVVRIHGDAVDIARRLEMHQGLRLCRPGMEDAASVPEELQYQAIICGDFANPRDEAGVDIETFHADVLLDTDG